LPEAKQRQIKFFIGGMKLARIRIRLAQASMTAASRRPLGSATQKEFVMKTFGLIAATALLIPSAPNTPAMAQSPRWGESFCAVFGGMEICYFGTRAQCEYARAKERNSFRDEGLTVEHCRPSDDIPGFEWEFFATFF
jgi:hypothetical protein